MEHSIGGAREAAEAFVGHPIGADPDVSLPGRLERREGEVRDGAHNPDGVRYLVERLPPGDHAIVLSILRDKDADAMLRELRRVGSRLVATRSSSDRALPAAELRWAKNDATPDGAINEAESIQPKDTGQFYRQVDCKYIYNLDVSRLAGAGTYEVWANINGANVTNSAMFDLR